MITSQGSDGLDLCIHVIVKNISHDPNTDTYLIILWFTVVDGFDQSAVYF